MKRNLTPARRVSALLLGAAALISLPALAQDVPAQQAAPPPAAEVPPAAPPVAPPPVIQTAPPPQAPAVTMAPQSPVVQAVPQAPVAQAPVPVTRAVRTSAQTRTTRSVTRTATPATQPAPTPASRTATTPAPRTATSPSAGDVAPEGSAVSNATTSSTPVAAAPPASEQPAAPANGGRTSLSTLLAWGFGIAIALVALGLLWVAVRRRNADGDVYVDQTPRSVRAPVMVEPEIPATMPLAAAPLAAAAPPSEQTERVFATEAQEEAAHELNGSEPRVVQPHAAESAAMHDADADDLAGIADTHAPVARRPWLELGMRPLRAGTSHKDAMVEVELIVGNAGDTAAEDVRISTFMLPAGSATEMDNLLTEHLADSSAPSVRIDPGEGTCVDAILSVPRSELNGDTSFEPLVVAEARYTLPDGSEGRTSAAFKLGVTDAEGDRFDPIALDRAEIFHTVAAQLHGTPEHV